VGNNAAKERLKRRAKERLERRSGPQPANSGRETYNVSAAVNYNERRAPVVGDNARMINVTQILEASG
jgi:hypothetical protein